MSRFIGKGIHPKTGEIHTVAFGHDSIPGFTPGYFFQVENNDRESDEEMIVEEGMLDGISKEALEELFKEWQVDTDKARPIQI